jgi:hypothetical protein
MDVGVSDILGVDLDYVDRDVLAIPREHFRVLDVSKPFDLGKKFDLVQSLEVGEHVPGARANVLIENLTAHGDLIMFSAAVPGQGGEYHINEQPYEYWHDKFSKRDYRSLDFVRPLIRANKRIEPWYRYNTFLFAKTRLLEKLHESVVATQLAPGGRVPDVSPLSWRIGNAVLRPLPVSVVTSLAVIKHMVVARRRGGAPER